MAEGDGPEPGDAIYAAFIPPEWAEHHIRATDTPSQWLAQEAQKAEVSRPLKDMVLAQYHNFRDIFSKEAFCHDLQHSGACRTYFPWPQTRRVDPGSILAEQCTMPDEATKVGMQNTDAHVCVPLHLVHKLVYIYPTSTGNFPQSGNQLRCHKTLVLFLFSRLTFCAVSTFSVSIQLDF